MAVVSALLGIWDWLGLGYDVILGGANFF